MAVAGAQRPVRPGHARAIERRGHDQVHQGDGRRNPSVSSSADDRVDGEPREVAAWFARLPDPEARDELARAFLPLAEHIARRFGGRGESVDDLTQVASMALLHAIDRFDPGREVRFSTFATVTILGELKRHFRDRGWAIRVPRNLQETSLLVNGILAELWQELGRAPTVQDVADRAHLSLDDVLEAMEAAQAYATSSLDAPVGDEGITVGDA